MEEMYACQVPSGAMMEDGRVVRAVGMNGKGDCRIHLTDGTTLFVTVTTVVKVSTIG